MDELKEVKRAVNPTEVLLVVDAMTGQEAAGSKISASCLYVFVLYALYQVPALANLARIYSAFKSLFS